MNTALEIKVGIFVVVATILIAIMGIVFGKIDFRKNKGYEVSFEIDNASGLVKTSPVLYKGIKVGNLKNIQFNKDKLYATIIIEHQYAIPDNVMFNIQSKGFIGEKFIELVQNQNMAMTGYLKQGYMYSNRQGSAGMDAMMSKFDAAAEEITNLISSLNDVFSNENTKIALSDTIQNLKNVSDSIEQLIANNNEKFNYIIENTQGITASLDKILSKNEKDINTTIANIKELTVSIKNIATSIDEITKNNEGNINDSIKNINEITEKLKEALNEINSIAKDINDGKGTIGMLINDEETKEAVKSVVNNVQSMVNKVYEWKLDVAFGADYLFDSKTSSKARGYVNLKLHTSPTTFYLLGISNTPRFSSSRTTTDYQLTTNPNNSGIIPNGVMSFQSIKEETESSKLGFNLQYGHIFYKALGIRVGLFESTLGAAIDVLPLRNDKLAFTFEAYDFNSDTNGKFEVFTRAYARWNFYRNFFIQAGVDDIFNFNNRVYTVGGGIRFFDDDLKFFAGSASSVVQ